MKSSAVVVLLLATVACGGSEPEAPKVRGSNAGKPFLPQEVTTTGMREGAAQKEPGKFVADAGEFTVEATIGDTPVTFRLGLDLVAFRIGDVPTLAYPIGYVKLDPLSIEGGDVKRDRTIADVLFRSLGSPIQIVYDVHSVGDMAGRLPESGGNATGKVIGTLQVDDRQLDLDLSAHFQRRDKTHLALQIDPVDVPLEEIGLGRRLQKLAQVLGVKRIGSTVRVAGSLELVTFEGQVLPTFPRTPVTVAKVEDVRQKIDDEVDDGEAARVKMLRTGTARIIADGVTTEYIEKGRALMEKAKTGGQPILQGGVED